MKKIIFFSSLLFLTGTLASCVRGDDLEFLRHPIHVTGSVDPQYGIPVATGQMNINDLLSNLSSEYQGLISSDPVVTVQYEADFSDTIHAASSIDIPNVKNFTAKGGPKDVWYSRDTTIVDTIDIDFFNDVDFRDQIDIEHIWLNIGVRAYGDCPDQVKPYIKGTFDNLSITYEDHDGTLKSYPGFSITPVQIEDITDGFERHFDSVDVASIVNDMPRRIFTHYHFRFKVNSALITDNIANMTYSEILDSVSMTKLIYAANLKVSMPLSVQFNNLNFSYDLDLGDGLSSVNLDSIFASIDTNIHLDINKASFRLTFNNGIPLSFTISAIMQDASGNDLFTVFNNATIAAANIGPNPDNPMQFVAVSEKETSIESVLSNSDIDNLNKARNLKVTLKSDSNNRAVSIRRSDYLKIKGYLIVDPSVHLDIPITDNGVL